MERKLAIIIFSLLLISSITIMLIDIGVAYRANVKILSPFSGVTIREPTLQVKTQVYLTSPMQHAYILQYSHAKREYVVKNRLMSNEVPVSTLLHALHKSEANITFEELGRYDIIAIITDESLTVGEILDSLPACTYASQITVEIVPTPTPTSTQEIIIDEIERIFPGQILFNVPENMTANEMERVEVRISKNFTENLTDGLIGLGVRHVEEIKVNSYMRVNLTGNQFNITPLSPEEQAVINSKFTQWGWDVTPWKSGILVLHFLVTLKLPLLDHHYIEWAHPVRDFRINVSSPKLHPEPSTPMPPTPAPTSPPKHEPLWGHLYEVVIAAILAAIFAILFEIWKCLQKRGE